MNKITIAAVVPVYNVEEYLEECLESICNQTEPFDEVILINDGSTDNSKLICEKFYEKNDNVFLINQENAGLSEARNAGIKAASSQYIVFIDSDDCIKNDTVEKLIKELENKEYDVAFFSASVLCDSGVLGSASYYVREDELCDRDMTGVEFFERSFPSNYIVSACLAIYRNDFLVKNKIFFEKGIFYEDNDFHFRICMYAQKVKCIKDVFYIRRYRAGSITSGTTSLKKCRDNIKVNQLLWKELDWAKISDKQKICFVSNYLLNTWNTISESVYLQDVQEQWNDLVNTFYRRWLDLYHSYSLEFNDKLSLFLMLNEMRTTYKEKNELKREIEAELIERLKELPLNRKDKLIGIYGIGRNTEQLLKLYKRYIGEIDSDIVFIVTENKQGIMTYMDYPVITCDKIMNEVDYILLPSLRFQKDMIETMKKNGVEEERIIKLYGDAEYCDYASVVRILKL